MSKRFGIVVVLALIVASCSSGSDSVATETVADVEAESDTDQSADIATEEAVADNGRFDGVSLGSSSVAPFDRVALDGLSSSDGVFALFELADGASWATPVASNADGAWFVAPPEPHDPYAGGEVELRLTDGVDVGAGLTLTVSSLPSGAATLDDLVEQMRSSIDVDAALFGSGWDELAGTSADEVRPDLLPLKIAQVLLDDGTEASVAGQLAGLDADAAALLGDLLVGAGFAKPLGVDALADLIADAEDEISGPTVSGFASAGRSRGVPLSRLPAVGGLARGGADCIPFFTETDVSAARLSEMMTSAALGAIASSSDTLAGQYLSGAEMAIGLSAALEAAATAGKGQVAKTAATLVTIEKMRRGMNAALLPSFFTNIDVTLDPAELEEDREEPGQWTEVWVTAMSTGYSLDADLVGLAIDSVGGEIVGKSGIPEGSLLEHEANAAVGEVKGTVTGMLPQEGTVTFCPSTFRVDIAGEDWSWARPLAALLTVDNSAQTYVNTKQIGDETLRFAPLPERFGGATIIGDLPVPTKAIDVQVSPDIIEVTTPGDVVQITAEIDHAVVKTLAWLAQEGQWNDGIGDDTNGPTTRPLRTPTDPAKYPFRVEVEATSSQGLRAQSPDRRYDFVEIRLAPIIVMPNPGSVEVRKDLAFTATDREGNLVDVGWTATGGTIARSGLGVGVYTAGSETGTYEVTATLRANSGVSATVPVNVGEFCLTGTWRINAVEFARLMSAGGATVTPAGGTWDITVGSDGSFTSTLTGFAFAISQGGTSVKVTMFGSQTGSVSYTATDITAVTTESYELSVIGEIGGQTIAFSPDDLPLGTEFGGGPYRCEDGQLIVDRDGLDVLYDKVG